MEGPGVFWFAPQMERFSSFFMYKKEGIPSLKS